MRRPAILPGAAGVVVMAFLAAWAAGAGWRIWTARAPADQAIGAAAATFQCSMHPQVVDDAPGSCPICGMALSRVDPAPASDTATASHAAAHGDPNAEAASRPPELSHAPFTLSAAREQRIGVKTATVEFRELHREIRTAGKVAFDPELYAALVEHRAATAAGESVRENATDERRRRLDGLRRSAALRLSLLGVSSSELAAIARVGGDATNLLLPGQSAWVYATVFGAGFATDFGTPSGAGLDLPRVDQTVVATARELPGRVFHGRLVTVEPIGGSTAIGSAAASRGVRVRALVATPGGGLRRGALVDLVVQVPLGRRLAVPEDAVIDTGVGQLVFVRHADGRFEPRDVVLGADGEGYVEVLAGLSAGERVVDAATFLIDSESRFRAALAAFAAEEPSSGSPAAR